MNITITLKILLLFLFCSETRAQAVGMIKQSNAYAVINVDLIPMTSDTVLADHTILIKAGIIDGVFATDSGIDLEVYEVIDGQGQFLMPGLADMHTHLKTPNDLLLNLFNGVTTVLDLGGQPGNLDLKRKVISEEVLGPQIFASVYIDGIEPTYWLADGTASPREALRRFKAQGFDFIKVYNRVSSKSFHALIEEGESLGLPVIGHGVRAVGIAESLRAGQKMIAHAEEYLYAHFEGNLNQDLIPEIARITKESGAYVTANLSTYESINEQWGDRYLPYREKILALPEMTYLNDATINNWSKSKRYANRSGSLDSNLTFLRHMIKQFQMAQVPMLLGTDSPSPDIVGMIPGFTIHNDLLAYKSAGLTNYEILEIGTKNAGKFISDNVSSDIKFGIIAEGYRADLILLKNNPANDLSNLKHISGIFVAGKWLTKDNIRNRILKSR